MNAAGAVYVKKTLTIIQIVIIAFIIVYGTVCLFCGNFEGAFATFPFLFFYYVFVVVRQKRQQSREGEEQ